MWHTTGSTTAAVVFEGNVAMVTRTYDTQTWLEWDGLMAGLTEAFGEPQDLSSFPDYATTRSIKEMTITNGSGKSSHLWQATADLRVMLIWDKTGLNVGYAYAPVFDKWHAGRAKPKF